MLTPAQRARLIDPVKEAAVKKKMVSMVQSHITHARTTDAGGVSPSSTSVPAVPGVSPPALGTPQPGDPGFVGPVMIEPLPSSPSPSQQLTTQRTLTPSQRAGILEPFKQAVERKKQQKASAQQLTPQQRYNIISRVKYPGFYSDAREEYRASGKIPVWASEQMVVPEGIVGVAGELYKRVGYEKWLGVDTSESSEELEHLLRSSKEFMLSQPIYEGGKTFQELKLDEPALYLKQTDVGEWVPSLDVVRFQQEQFRELGKTESILDVGSKMASGFTPLQVAKALSASVLTFPITIATMIPEIFGGAFEATKEHGPMATGPGAVLGFVRGKEKTVGKIATFEYETQKDLWKGDPLAYAKLYLANPAMTDIVYPFAIGAGFTAGMGYISKAGASVAAAHPMAGAVMKAYPYAVGTVMSGVVGADVGMSLAMEHKGLVPSGETGVKVTRYGMQIGMMALGGMWARSPETIAYYRGVQQKIGVAKTRMASYFEPLSSKITGFKTSGVEMGRMKSMVKDYPFHVFEGKGVPIGTRLMGVGSRIKTSFFEPSPYSYITRYAPETVGIQRGRADVLWDHRPIGSSRFVTTREQIMFKRPDPFMGYKTRSVWGGYEHSWEFYRSTVIPEPFIAKQMVYKLDVVGGKPVTTYFYQPIRGQTIGKGLIIGEPVGYRYVGETRPFKSPVTYKSYGVSDVGYRYISETRPFKAPHEYMSYGIKEAGYRYVGETRPFKSPVTYKSYGASDVGYRYITKTKPLPKFKKLGWSEIYRSMEAYGLPSEPIPSTITVSKTITAPVFTTIGGGFKSVTPTARQVGMSIPDSWAIATGHVGLGFLEWLEEGTGVVHSRWDKTRPSGIGLKPTTDLTPKTDVDVGKISTGMLGTGLMGDTRSLLDIKSRLKVKPGVETIKAIDIVSASKVGFAPALAMDQRLDLDVVPIMAQVQVQQQKYQQELIVKSSVVPTITPTISPTVFTPPTAVPLFFDTGGFESKYDLFMGKRKRKKMLPDLWRIHPVQMKWGLVEKIV